MNRGKTLWGRVVNTGTEGMKPYDPNLGICRGINLLTMWVMLINLVAGPLFAIESGKISVFVGSMFEVLFLSGIILLNHYRRHTTANVIFYLILNAATLYFSFILGQSAEAQLMIVLLVGLAFFIFVRLWVRMLCITTTIILLIVMEANFKYKFIHSIYTDQNVHDYMRWVAYAVIISLVSILFYLYALNNSILLEQLKKYSINIENNLEKEKQVNQKKSRFISNTYHEVRGHFWSVFVIIKILTQAKTIQDVKNLRKILMNLNNGCQNLQMVLSNILEYSRFDAGIMEKPLYEPVSLEMVIGQLVDISRYPASEKNVNVEFKISGDIPEYVACDRLKLTLIITNLLNNAVKFSNPNTTILVLVDSDNDNWRITIKDQGTGIPKDKLAKIFDPFITDRTGSNNVEGVGLGLHITNQLVGVLKGEIRVNSEEDKGSTFMVYLQRIEFVPMNEKLNTEYREASI